MKNVSREGEEREKARKGVMLENEVSTPALSGGGSMESFGSTKEEGNFNTPITAPHNIDYSSFSYVLGTG